jgi:hypothetical protein
VAQRRGAQAGELVPERWIEELRRDGLEVMEDKLEGKVAIFGAAV